MNSDDVVMPQIIVPRKKKRIVIPSGVIFYALTSGEDNLMSLGEICRKRARGSIKESINTALAEAQ